MTVKDSIDETVSRIARAVRDNRKAAKLSQTELADLAGVGKTAVFDLEKGKQTVQLDTVLKIFAVLRIRLTLNAPVDERKRSETKS